MCRQQSLFTVASLSHLISNGPSILHKDKHGQMYDYKIIDNGVIMVHFIA